MEKRTLSFETIFTDGINIGVKNAASILGALVLYVLTIWIPYINVGTTIAISAIPIELSKGGVISPTFIFNARYRKFMGEYFNLVGLQAMSLIPAFLFGVIPGIIISIGWSLALYLMIDKEISPSEALVESSKATYGHKGTIFLVNFVIVICFYILAVIFSAFTDGTLWFILILVLAVLAEAIAIGCNTVIYRDLVVKPEAVEQEPAATEQ